jgi:hypothetical protein
MGALASCYLKDKDRAAKYVRNLKGQRQNIIKQTCAREGIMIE